jgi:hypothetical protein
MNDHAVRALIRGILHRELVELEESLVEKMTRRFNDEIAERATETVADLRITSHVVDMQPKAVEAEQATRTEQKSKTIGQRQTLQRVDAIYGSHEVLILHHLNWCTMHPDQLFDVTFYQREPLLDVTVEKRFARDFQSALMYGTSMERLQELLKQVHFSDGTTVNAAEIWTINWMPLDVDSTAVDLAAGAGGRCRDETVRQMIHETYRCKSRAEEDWFLARWIAS